MTPRAGPMTRALRMAVSLTVLALLALVVDVGEVGARLSDMRPGWVVLALAVSVLQVGLSAWRWRFTAGRLGIDLPLGAAVREYYLATFLNQAMPGGVVGDVSRAWRHAGSVEGAERASRSTTVHAVILERASGQAVMAAVALVAVGWIVVGDFPASVPPAIWIAAALAVGVSTLWAVRRIARGLARSPLFHRLREDGRTALLGPALPVQAGASLAIVASYVGVFLICARAVGVQTPSLDLAPLVPPVLFAMLLPVSVAGWGVREGAAAVLWGSVGLTPADGVAISVAYGLLTLTASLPGAAALSLTPRRGAASTRRGRRRRGGSDGPEAGWPRPASRSEEG